VSYYEIENLYKSQEILLFKECYALEKIHGTSSHIAWKAGEIRFFTGEIYEDFKVLFDETDLRSKFEELGYSEIVIYGENYGGRIQGQSHRYGKEKRFIAFEVKIGKSWLNVSNAEDVVKKFGLDFVYYKKIGTSLEEINAERDAPSIQAERNGMGSNHKREGVVLRPLIEVIKNNGERIIAKHKGDDFKETKTPREVGPAKFKILSDATAIADEWVTPMRLAHVLQKLAEDHPRNSKLGMEITGDLVEGMIADIVKEGSGEIVDSKDARKAIGRKTAILFKDYLQRKFEAEWLPVR